MPRLGSSFVTAASRSGRRASSSKRSSVSPLPSDDVRITAEGQASTVLGGYLRWWIDLEGEKDGHNVVFTVPYPIRIATDIAGAPMCLPIWRARVNLVWTPENPPKPGEFAFVAGDSFDSLILGEPPQSGDKLVLSWCVISLAS